MSPIPNEVSLSQTLIMELEAVNVWLNTESVQASSISPRHLSYARKVLGHGTGNDSTRMNLGASVKAELDILGELTAILIQHLDVDEQTLLPISATEAIAYRRTVLDLIDSHWLSVASIDVRVALLQTAIRFDRTYLRLAMEYRRRVWPHSKFVVELQRRLLQSCIQPYSKKVPRLLRFPPLLVALSLPVLLLERVSKLERSRLAAMEAASRANVPERQARNVLAGTVNTRRRHRRNADLLSASSRSRAELTYLIPKLPELAGKALKGSCRQNGRSLLRRIGKLFGYWGGSRRTKQRILVSRGYGGIGDLTMMSSGIKALADANEVVIFGIPTSFQAYVSSYFSAEVEVRDVPRFREITLYDRVYDLTICPTWGTELTRLLKVAVPRHIIFCQALGLPDSTIFSLKPIEIKRNLPDAVGKRFKVSVQLNSDEPYRNPVGMESLVNRIARLDGIDVVALCTHTNPRLHPRVKQTAGLPLVESVREIESSGLMICPDSAFLHIGEGLNIRTICIAGPTVSTLVSSYYNHASIIRDSDYAACSPCYRSQGTPCKLLGFVDLNSPCLDSAWFYDYILQQIRHELSAITR